MAPDCIHPRFHGSLRVQMIKDGDGTVQYIAVTSLECEECKRPFVFPSGLPEHKIVIRPMPPRPTKLALAVDNALKQPA